MTTRNGIDWTELRERRRIAEKATEESGRISSERREQILRMRADVLASPIGLQRESDVAQSVAVFRSGSDQYAIPLSEITEVIRAPEIAAVPHAPAFVAGLMQVRGEIRPVYHLRALLGHESGTPTIPGMVVLARTASAIFGIGVDAVEDIRQVSPESRIATPVTPGHAGWMTTDLIPCLAADTLIPEKN